ncbi:hypothetical protein X801_07074, partial [Opisthorchis viverrini]
MYLFLFKAQAVGCNIASKRNTLSTTNGVSFSIPHAERGEKTFPGTDGDSSEKPKTCSCIFDCFLLNDSFETKFDLHVYLSIQSKNSRLQYCHEANYIIHNEQSQSFNVTCIKGRKSIFEN